MRRLNNTLTSPPRNKKNGWWKVLLALMVFVVIRYYPSEDQSVNNTQNVAVPDDTQDAAVYKPYHGQPWPLSEGENTATPTLAEKLTATNYYVIFDGSGSMDSQDCAEGSKKIQVAKDAVNRFAQSVSAEDNLGLLIFDSHGIRDVLPLGTQNRDEFVKHVNDVVAGATTPLKTALEVGVARLTEQARRQLGYGEYHLVVVTDGEAYPENEDPTDVVFKTLSTSPVVIQTIGFCIAGEHSLNQPGRTIYYSANSPEELKQGLTRVLAEADDFSVTDFEDKGDTR
ncbi:MAG: VWA domain-containing protein [Deltaproteobacteria bacterium]|nr:VWA domain-containing protein [Deltaproteobacteria bacterium]